MSSYILDGIWVAKNSALIGVALFIAFQGVLLLVKKRAISDYRGISKVLLASELLLCIYICAILKITGIIDHEVYFGFSPANLMGFITVPFVGASIKMVTLNFLLFVPYGFLVFLVSKGAQMSWRKALLVGFLSSLLIEMVQAFTGRLTELDDLIINTAGFVSGFLVADGIGKAIDKGDLKGGLVEVALVAAVSLAGLFLLSFLANGDRVQAEEDAYYKGIAGAMGTLDEETEDMAEFNVYYEGEKKDALKNGNWNLYDWYMSMGIDVDNKAGLYSVENCDSDHLAFDPEKIYLEVVYSSPQLFRFYNNHGWVMENIVHMVYCPEDGQLWYGEGADALDYHAYYNSSEYSYDPDEELIEAVRTWMETK
ncbi:MAG: VanZ family protein [Firmicutes bacterium]|nr:VanZ family protein [Bacillota bacterium]